MDIVLVKLEYLVEMQLVLQRKVMEKKKGLAYEADENQQQKK